MRLYVVAVAHVSKKSVSLVQSTIRRKKPDAVAVELDVLRLRSLLSNQRPSPRPGLAYALYVFQQALGKFYGAQPGGEMLAAVQEAAALGVPVFPVDRDVRVTLSRLQRIPFKEKAGFLFQALGLPLMFIRLGFSVDSLLQPKILSSLMRDFSRSFPVSYGVLVRERDDFMAQKLVGIEKAGFKRVVLVIGAGHKRGLLARVVKHAKKNDDCSIKISLV